LVLDVSTAFSSSKIISSYVGSMLFSGKKAAEIVAAKIKELGR